MESNDSPESPDRGETSDIPGLPSGDKKQRKKKKYMLGMHIYLLIMASSRLIDWFLIWPCQPRWSYNLGESSSQNFSEIFLTI